MRGLKRPKWAFDLITIFLKGGSLKYPRNRIHKLDKQPILSIFIQAKLTFKPVGRGIDYSMSIYVFEILSPS